MPLRLIGLALLILPLPVAAATLYFSPSDIRLEAGVESSFILYADAPEAPVHAAEADISYDPALLRVVQVSSATSLLTNFSTQPTSTGALIRFSGWMQQAFRGTRGELLRITVLPLGTGTTTLEMKSGTLLSADVQENNVAAGLASARVVISPHRVAPPAVASASTTVEAATSSTITADAATTSAAVPTSLEATSTPGQIANQAAAAGFLGGLFSFDIMALVGIILGSMALGAFIGYLFFRAGQA